MEGKGRGPRRGEIPHMTSLANHLLIQGGLVVLEEGVEPSCPVKGAGF